MIVTVDPSALRQTTWYEYAIRFVFGGLVTAAVGLITNEWGPSVGGLFLAFPAIFPASATLVEKHEDEKKAEEGLAGHRRGRKSAAASAAGAAIGSIGLIAFGLTVWTLAPHLHGGLVLAVATAVWFGVAALGWLVRKRYWPRSWSPPQAMEG
jgi:hypothetical protein